jgi:hypothetical protein
MEYNGWKNYETWNVALWLGNDQGTYSLHCEMAQEAYDENDGDKGSAASDLAKKIEEFVDENNPLAGESSMFSDLLNSALSEVDYYEIAEHYLADVEETAPEEEEETETNQ